MQQTCSRCGGLLVPGASVCNYCGLPVPASIYPQAGSVPPGWQANSTPPPSTQYGYTQTVSGADPYAAQYSQSAPPAAAPGGSGGYGPPPFGQPSQPSPFGPPPAPSPFGPPPQQKKSSGLLIGVIALIVVVVAGLGTGGYFLLRGNNNNNPQANVTPTPTVAPLYQASLTSDPGSWDCGTSGTCAFSSDGYHLKATKEGFIEDSILLKQPFDDVVIEVKGIIAQGDPQDAGVGIEFHVPPDNKAAGYGFFVYIDGTYDVLKWDSEGNASNLIRTTPSSAIHAGPQQPNDLKIVIENGHFTFYDNGQKLIDTGDSAYSSGYIGLAAATVDTEAIFSNLIITKPQPGAA